MLLPLGKAPGLLASVALLVDAVFSKETIQPRDDQVVLRRACPSYSEYSQVTQ
jgi:hypothetical protein